MDKKINVKFTGGREGTSFPIAREQLSMRGYIDWGAEAQNRIDGSGKRAGLRMQLERVGLTAETVTGTLKGYDALMNLVLDDVEELLQGKHFLPPPIHHPTQSLI